MTKLIKRYKQGNKSPDHDPDNPYHYHTGDGKKVVITPEDWEANVGKPYFKEIEDAVRAEQAAYPEPEYEVNPDFVRDLRSTYAGNMGYGYQNYRNFGDSLPEGYSFTPEGVVVGPDGTAYVQSGYKQTPRFTYSTDNPLQFTIYKGKPIERNLTFYPVNMDKRVKAPLPVDRVMNVSSEREKAIENYIETNTTPKQRINYINSALVSYLYPDLATGSGKQETQRGINEAKKLGFKYILDNYTPDQYNSWLIGFTDNEFEKFKRDLWDKTSFLNPDGSRYISIDGNYYDKNAFFDPNWYVSKDNPTIKHSAGWGVGPNGNMGFQTRYIGGKPSNQEAEKKAIISIGPLEKVNTFATGGSMSPNEPPESEDNKIYQSIWNISKEENPNGQKERLEIISANNYVKPYTAVLRTYPYFHKNYVISHSALRAYRDGFDHQMNPVSVSKYFDDSNYNLFNNNCSDATGEALNLDTKGLTTPKYIREQVLKKHPDAKEHTRKDNVIFTKFPISKAEYDRIKAEQIKQTRINNGEVSENYSIEDALHDNTFATGGHLYQDGGSIKIGYAAGGKLKLIPRALRGIPFSVILQPAVADNTRYVRPYTSIEIAKSKKAYEQEQLQKLIEAAQERLPLLKADTRSTEQRQRDHNRAIQLEVKQKANELAANFGRALGANHDMTVDEVNQNTLNTANLMGYMAAPYLMTTLESGYYLGTSRPKEAALTAGVGYGLPIIFRGMLQLPNTARSYVASRELNRGIKQATKQGDIRVLESYFNNPDKWYRVTETPEVHGIELSGRNVTTKDIEPGTIHADDFRRTVGNNGLIAGTGENEGYWILKPERFNMFKGGQAHGNTSQAAKGQIWQGTFAKSGKFPTVILEGEGNKPTFRGMTHEGHDSRSHFILLNWEDIPQGARLGFHTGEMPLGNLRWFQRNSDGTFTFKGSLLPNNTMYQATIYKGGPIRSERSFFTTDPQYALLFGPVKSYTFEGRTSQAGEPLMGNRDIASEDFFVYNNTRGAENADAILGHDLITEDKPYHSQGMELLVSNLSKVRQNPKVPTLNEVATLKNDYNTFAQRHHYKHYHGLEDSESIRRASQTSESTEEELKSVFSDIRKQEELNAVAGGSTNSDGNLYFKQGIDYTVRPLLKETLEVIDLQIAPRLFGLRLSLMKLPVNDGYYRGSIDLVKKKTRVSEWNPEMISEYNRLNNESSGGWSLPDKPYIVVGKSDLRPTAQTEVHEARHQIQKSIKPTLEESKILKLAYSDVPKPSNPDGSVKPGYENYDMSVEYETMNTEARKVLLDKAGYKYDPNLSSEQNLEIQNKLLDNYSEKDIASILIDNRTGYWNNYIRQLTKNYDGPLESWVKTDEGKKKIHDWIKAMKYVGVSAGIIGTVKHSKGGKLIARQ